MNTVVSYAFRPYLVRSGTNRISRASGENLSVNLCYIACRQGIDAASYDIVIALQSHVLTALTNALLRSR